MDMVILINIICGFIYKFDDVSEITTVDWLVLITCEKFKSLKHVTFLNNIILSICASILSPIGYLIMMSALTGKLW